MKTRPINRILSLVLCVCMVLSMMPGIPLVAQAAGTEGMITIELTDSYGDGWNGNAIEIYVDGELLDTATIESGKSNTWTAEINPHAAYSFKWVEGSYASETSFVIYVGTEEKLSAGGSGYSTGDELLSVAAACAEPVYENGICTKCGAACVHQMNNGVCSVCGYQCPGHSCSDGACVNCGELCPHSLVVEGVCSQCSQEVNLTLELAEKYSDGWTDNAIKVYADGVLLGTLTVEAGVKNKTWSTPFDSYTEYTFEWVKGSYSDECSFDILVGSEKKYAAYDNTCGNLTEGVFFTIESSCPHDRFGEDLKCTTCGKLCQHKAWTDSVCDVCGFACGTDADHAWILGTCDVCGLVCAHESWTDSVCDTCAFACGTDAKHSFGDDLECDVCGFVCGTNADHAWILGTCDVCGFVCAHESWTDSVCDTCAFVCGSDAKHSVGDDLECDVCGFVCGTTADHAWSKGACAVCAVVCPHESYEDGLCTNCGYYEPMVPSGTGDNGFALYEIYTASQLLWFADYVNSGEVLKTVEHNGNYTYYTTNCVNAKLMADIDMTGLPWTPIGVMDTNNALYNGVFDGNGHTVSGIDCTATSGAVVYAGFFGKFSGTVKNLNVQGTFKAVGSSGVQAFAGGIAAHCTVTSYCNGTDEFTVVYPVIENCTFIGTVSAESSYQTQVGGIVGQSGSGTVTNSLAAATVISSEATGVYAGALVGINAASTYTNCYYDSTLCSLDACGDEEITGVTGLATEAFADGSVAYALGFGQTLGTDAYPTYGDDAVYIATSPCVTYSNTQAEATEKAHVGTATCTAAAVCEVCGESFGEPLGHGEYGADGKCTVCGAYEEPKQNGVGDNGFALYEIYTAGQLLWFADYVNSGEVLKTEVCYDDYDQWTIYYTANHVNAKLMADIDMTGLPWSPIGNKDISGAGYTGVFDGNGYTVSGIDCTVTSNGDAYAGFFGYFTGTVKNLTVKGSFKAVSTDDGTFSYAGGIAGQADRWYYFGTNYALVEFFSTFENCTFIGTVSAEANYCTGVGGITGYFQKGTMTNCLAAAAVTSSEATYMYAGALVGSTSDSTFTNCYYDSALCSLNACKDGALEGVTGLATEAFADGSVAYALGFGQTLGTDTYPTYGDDAVYQVLNCKEETAYSNTDENLDHVWVDSTCTLCGDVCAHTGGEATCTEKAKCEICGASYGELADHTIENHVCTLCGAMEIVVSFDAGDFNWKTGDTLYFCRVSRDYEWEEYCFTATVAEDGTVTWTPDKTLYWDGTGEHRLIVSYPANMGLGWDDFAIPADQSDVEKLKEADCMNARWAGTPTTNVINFELTHRMAKVTVNYEVAEDVTVKISKFEVYSNSKYCIFTDADGMPIITSVIQQLDVWVTPYHNGNQFTAFVSPDAYAADGNFIKITLENGTVYEVKMNKAVTFEEGAEYTYKVIITADGAYLTCANGCTNFTYTDNGNGTHKKVCTECGYEVASEPHNGTATYTLNPDDSTKHDATYDCCGATVTEDHTPDETIGQTCKGYQCAKCGEWYGDVDYYNHTGPYTAVFNWPENTSDLYMYVSLNCECGGEVDYAYVYGENFTVESEVEATDCQNPGSVTYSVTVTLNGEEYTETKTYTVLSENHVGEPVNGFCSACNGYEAAVWNEEKGVYEISNAGQLYWYAQYLNTTNAEISAELTADIVIPENAPNWEPINASYVYFNGNFHTISGLKCVGDENMTYVGLFGMEGWWYEISNLHITDSYFEGSGYVGAVVACMTNGGSVTNCYVTNTTVKGDGDHVGTLAGYLTMGSVVGCYVDTDTLVGGYSNGYASIENSYYLSETETEDGGKTAAQFASGEVAYLLQAGVAEDGYYDENDNWVTYIPEIWGQTCGEGYPVFGGAKVYQVADCAGGTAYSNTDATLDHTWVDADCDTPKTCSTCGATEGDALGHSYNNDCDANCNTCGETREVGDHSYTADCDADCNICGATREAGDHSYTDLCDADCDACGQTREAPHVKRDCMDYCWDCDATGLPTTAEHVGDGDGWCSVCGDKLGCDYGYHSYDDDCDADCNLCGETRDAGHVDNGSGRCAVCGDELGCDYGYHSYDNNCDADCNTCGQTREAPHYPSEYPCNYYCCVCLAPLGNTAEHQDDGEGRCSVCFSELGCDFGYHTYDDDCDAVCDGCGQTREAPHYKHECADCCMVCGITGLPATGEHEDNGYGNCDTCGTKLGCDFGYHSYDNDCDTDCNTCGETRVAPHYKQDCQDCCGVCGGTDLPTTAEHVDDGEGYCYNCVTKLGCDFGYHTYENDCDTDCNGCGITREVGDHEDNGNGYCIYCDATLGCDFGYHTGVLDYIDNGDGTHSAAYDCCGEVVPDDVEHKYDENNTCQCGAEKAAAPAITLRYPALSFEDEIRYNVFYTVEGMDGVSTSDMGLIVFDSALENGTMDDAAEIIPGVSTYGEMFVAQSNGIPAKKMGDTLYFKVYAQLSDGSYVYSELNNYSAVQYAQSILNGAYNDSLKALCVALLNYGAAAQEYFGYNAENLMNAGLTDEQKAMVEDYNDGMLEAVAKADASKTAELTANGGYSLKYPAVDFGSAFGINYNFIPANPVEGEMKLYVWSADAYENAETLTLDNASDVITMTAGENGIYMANVSGIAAKEIDETVYVCGVYQSGGETYYTGVLAYSLAAYCKTKANGTTGIQTLAAATAVYAYYAKLYLPSN